MQGGTERFDVTIAKIVAENDNEVWRALIRRCGMGDGQQAGTSHERKEW